MKLRPLQLLRAIYNVVFLIRNPQRVDKAFAFTDAVAKSGAFAPIVEKLRQDPAMARALEERHPLRMDLPALRSLPEYTFGRTFAEHLIANKLEPIPALSSEDPVGYFLTHLRETHDIWHVVTGNGTDIAGEAGIWAFLFAQIPGAFPGFFLAIGLLRVAIYDKALKVSMMEAITRSWSAGRAARPLFGVHWDELWRLPLAEVRAQLGLPVTVPVFPVRTVDSVTSLAS
jgi:ubiquinone biosynthesis protein COQ4